MTGALAVTDAVSTALSSVDLDFTKTMLEHVERELRRHASRLAAEHTAPSRRQPVEMEPVPGPSGRQVSSHAVVSVEEESSEPSGHYATAASLSSLEIEEQPSASLSSRPADDNSDHFVETAI